MRAARRIGAIVFGLVAVVSGSSSLQGQSLPGPPMHGRAETGDGPVLFAPLRGRQVDFLPEVGEGVPVPQERPGASAGQAALLSLVIPGLGQYALGQKRTWVYLTLEAVGWVFYADRRGAGNDYRRRYRDFAWDEARIQSGPRVDGTFDYYEKMTQWDRSGLFDVDPTEVGVQPEPDPTTYNGSIWRLATQLFLPDWPDTPTTDPGYDRAISYYTERGFGTEFLWDWTGTGDAREQYAGLIRTSDRRYAQATNILGVIIANHVVSAADAYLSARHVPTPSEIRVAPTTAPLGTRWHVFVAFGAGP